MKKFFIFLFAILLFSPLSATDYYVKNGGNDGASGLDDDNAWETVNKVNTSSFSADDNIYFKKGDIWYEQLKPPDSGSSGQPITFGAYGSGADPIISGMREVTGWDTGGNWADQGGNIWLYDDLGTNPRRLVIDGTEYIENEDAVIDATYRWFYNTGAGGDLYVYSVGNPATTYSSMYFADDVLCIWIDAQSYITIQDIDMQGGEWALYIKNASTNILVHDCTIGKYTWSQAIRIVGETAGSYNQATDIEIYDSLIDSEYHNSATDWDNGVAGDGIIFLDNVASSKLYGCTLVDWAHACVEIECTNANCQTEYLEIYDNIMDGSGSNDCRGFDITNGDLTDQTAYIKIYRNIIRNTCTRNQLNGNHNEFYYNIIHTTTEGLTANYADGLMLMGVNGVCHDNKAYNNVIYNVDRNGIYIPDWGGEDINDNLIRNNIIMNWDMGSGASKYGIVIEDDAGTYDNTYENNLLYKAATPDVVNYRGAPRTIAEFNGEDGGPEGDVMNDNIGGDPLFVNAGSADFHLQSGSPCIETGKDVGLATDFTGTTTVPQGNFPEIGAYEYPANILRIREILRIRNVLRIK